MVDLWFFVFAMIPSSCACLWRDEKVCGRFGLAADLRVTGDEWGGKMELIHSCRSVRQNQL